jgi:hypothetical protein
MIIKNIRNNLAWGTYFLRVADDSGALKTFRMVKN